MKKLIYGALALSIVMFSCQKENIEPKGITDSSTVNVESVKYKELKSEEKKLIEDLELKIQKEICDYRDDIDRSSVSVNNQYNPYDYLGSSYSVAILSTNDYFNKNAVLNDVNQLSTEDYDLYKSKFLSEFDNIESNIPTFSVSNVNYFEEVIFKSYANNVLTIKNRNLFVVLTKIYENFVVNNVQNIERKKRLLIYLTLNKYVKTTILENGLIINGVDVPVYFCSGCWENCMQRKFESMTWGDWYEWSVGFIDCMVSNALDCAEEATS